MGYREDIRANYTCRENFYNSHPRTTILWRETLQPMEHNEILTRAIYDRTAKNSVICYSYMCKNTKLSEQLIKDLIFIQSDFFGFDAWNDKNVDYIAELAKSGKNVNRYDDIKHIASGKADVTPELVEKAKELIKVEKKRRADAVKALEATIENEIKLYTESYPDKIRQVEILLNQHFELTNSDDEVERKRAIKLVKGDKELREGYIKAIDLHKNYEIKYRERLDRMKADINNLELYPFYDKLDWSAIIVHQKHIDREFIKGFANLMAIPKTDKKFDVYKVGDDEDV